MDADSERKMIGRLTKLRAIEVAKLILKAQELMESKMREGALDDVQVLAEAIEALAKTLADLRRGERESEMLDLQKRRQAVSEARLALKRAKLEKWEKDLEMLMQQRVRKEQALNPGLPQKEPHEDGRRRRAGGLERCKRRKRGWRR